MGGGLRWEPIRGRPNIEDKRSETVLSHIEGHRGINRVVRKESNMKYIWFWMIFYSLVGWIAGISLAVYLICD